MKRIAAFLFGSAMIVFSSCSKENQTAFRDKLAIFGYLIVVILFSVAAIDEPHEFVNIFL